MKSQSISAQETALSNDLNDTCRRVSDLKLVNRALVGDPEAFATLFNTHKPAIYSICLRMTNNIAQAEDLTQDAFLQVFRKLSTFRGNSALSTWLYRIAVNTVPRISARKFETGPLTKPGHDQPQCDGNMAARRSLTNGGSGYLAPSRVCAWLQNQFRCTRSKGITTTKSRGC